MAQETEAKFYISKPARMRQRIVSLGSELVDERVLEVNLRFDTPDRDLHRLGRVLRLRMDTRARLTFKDADSMEAGALSRREVEVTVSDFDTAKELLEALGYEVAFVYEKYRTTFKFDGLEIVLDELPYGHFVEIEGEAHALKATADRLGLDWERVIHESYSKLFENLRTGRKLDQSDLTFDSLRGFQVSASDLGVEPADAG